MAARRRPFDKTPFKNRLNTPPQLDVSENTIHPRILRQARKSGQLALANRGLTAIPPAVWKINIEVEPPKEGVLSMSMAEQLDDQDEKWWEQEPLQKLILSSNKLTTISDDVKYLTALAVLDLTDNELTSLPEAIGECRNLRRISLSRNKLNSLPISLFELEELRFLKADQNRIKSIPENFVNLRNLEELDLTENSLTQLPEKFTFNGLKIHRLLLGSNRLVSFPPGIGWVQTIRTLDLSSNQLTSIPEDIGELQLLEVLLINSNKITTLPVFDRCYKLKELHAGINYISAFPDEFFERLPSLAILDMHDNKLKSIPISITNIDGLERINFQRNDLRAVPAQFCLMQNLKTLMLTQNPIRTIRKDILERPTHELLTFLQTRMDDGNLGAEKTQESQVEVEGGDAMPSTGVPALQLNSSSKAKRPTTRPSTAAPKTGARTPKAFDVSRTKCFSYKNQKADTLSETTIEEYCGVGDKMVDINTVDLTRNQFNHIPESLAIYCHCIHSIVMASNRIETLNDDVTKFKLLRSLDLRQNHLSDLPDSLASCLLLRELIIAANRFKLLPDVIYKMDNLEILVANDNSIDIIDGTKLAAMPMLSTLGLRNNNLAKLSPELGNSTTIRSLEVDGNAFRVPNYSVLSKGTAHVLKYLKGRITVDG